MKGWEGLSSVIQVLLLIGFFAWVAFWSFLTINFRPALVRLYEGYWSEENFFIRPLKRWRRQYWQRRWDKLSEDDDQLNKQQSILAGEQYEYQRLRKFLIEFSTETQLDSQQVTISEEELGRSLKTLDKDIQRLQKEVSFDSQLEKKLQSLRQQVRSLWREILPKNIKVKEEEKRVWNKYQDQLEKLTDSLEKLVNRLFGEVEEQRIRLNNQFFLYYPPHRDDVMPTQLGNVLKGAERAVQERYQLDAVLIWPRLQPALPNEFAQPLQDAKMSLDLVVTLSSYTLLFGLPLSIWLSLESSARLPWWIPLVQIVLALLLRSDISFIMAALAFGLTWGISLTPSFLTTYFIKLQIFLILAAGIFLAVWITYQNAIQAAVAYGEKIKAAFDLYRWKTLEGLNLQLPPNYEEERQLWKQVCGLLYRNYPPHSDYYRYVKQTNTKEPAPKPPDKISIPVPKKLLPIYHLITTDDLKEIEIPEAQIHENALKEHSAIIGRCSLQSLPAHQPILMSALTEEKYLKDTVAVGIQATPAMTFGGQLKSGDIVNIIIMPTGTASTPVVRENLLVLDVKSVTTQTDDKSPDNPFVVVIALPKSQQIEFASQTFGATLLLTRKL